MSASVSPSPPCLFDNSPLSPETKLTLSTLGYSEMTPVQQKCLQPALDGQDLIVSAKTGSGKTICFAVAIVERLVQLQWTEYDRVGAVVLSPTQELALQNYEVIRRVASGHALAVGLLSGGSSSKEEEMFVDKINIAVATPGRLLHHLDKTLLFSTDRLQMLVIDEADRLADGSFDDTLPFILQHLPATKQTLLFSATHSSSSETLFGAITKNPVCVCEAQTQIEIPEKIDQIAVRCFLHDKTLLVYALIKRNFKSKMIFFLATTKQVLFFAELFSRMQLSVPVLHIHGKQNAEHKEATCQKFSQRRNAVLFATDIAARGLDFTNVHLIVQVDKPETPDDYVHRIGRTGRFGAGGRSYLFLAGYEEQFLQLLAQKEVRVREKSSQALLAKIDKDEIQNKIEKTVAENKEIAAMAQRAAKAYGKSLQRSLVDASAAAEIEQEHHRSLGLPIASAAPDD